MWLIEMMDLFNFVFVGQLLIEFDQITPSEQMTLKCASVIGYACSTQILHVLWPFPAANLNSALESLFNKDILRCYKAAKEVKPGC